MNHLAFALPVVNKYKYVHPTQVCLCLQGKFLVRKKSVVHTMAKLLSNIFNYSLYLIGGMQGILQKGVRHYLITFQEDIGFDFITGRCVKGKMVRILPYALHRLFRWHHACMGCPQWNIKSCVDWACQKQLRARL